MSREIKFRGKRIDTGEWVYGGVSVFGKDVTIYDCDCIVNSAYEVISESIGQFTGLKDKNDIDVYEGDIIKWKTTRYHTKEQEEKQIAMPKYFISPVLFHEGTFLVNESDTISLEIETYDTFLCCFFNDSMDNKFDFKAEVIGNIHDNLELL